jgi:hypothetical protein
VLPLYQAAKFDVLVVGNIKIIIFWDATCVISEELLLPFVAATLPNNMISHPRRLILKDGISENEAKVLF